MSAATGTRTRVAFYGQPRATLLSTPFGVPQARINGKIDKEWIDDDVPVSVRGVEGLRDLPTAQAKLGKLVLMINGVTETHEIWQLNEGDEEDAPIDGIVRGKDFSSVNQRFWKRC